MDPIRVLIVEDDKDIADLLQVTLEPQIECLRAENGLEGLQLADRGEPDFVVSDVMMPVIDGYEFISRLRKDPRFVELPVVFLSALGARDQVRKGYNLGASLYLSKPIDPSRFKRMIEIFIADHGIKSHKKRNDIKEAQKLICGEPESGKRKATAPPRRIDAQRDSTLGPRIRLLLVEDDTDVVEMIRTAIDREHRLELVRAMNGIEAIELAVRYNPDIFIIDGMLPKMTGYQLVTMLRKNRIFQEAPIIFISGKATARDRQYVQRLGIDTFLPKPFEPQTLIDAICAIVAQPGFKIHEERVSSKQMQLETLRDFETHRMESH